MNRKKYYSNFEWLMNGKDERSKSFNFFRVDMQLFFIFLEKTANATDIWVIYVRQSLNFAQ